jgi:hypothetical protein
LTHRLYEGFTITDVTLNNDFYALSVDGYGNFALTENGFYLIILRHSVLAYSYELRIEIDNIPPTVLITQPDSKSVKVSDASKNNLICVLLKDGNEISYSLGRLITDVGSYKLTIVDDLGNSNTYEFTINYSLNGWGILVVIIGIILAIIMLAIVIRARTKIKVK